MIMKLVVYLVFLLLRINKAKKYESYFGVCFLSVILQYYNEFQCLYDHYRSLLIKNICMTPLNRNYVYIGTLRKIRRV